MIYFTSINSESVVAIMNHMTLKVSGFEYKKEVTIVQEV